MSSKPRENETYSKHKTDSDSEDDDNDTSLSLAEVFDGEDLEDAEDYSDVGKHVIDNPPIKCPRCGSELDPAPYASYACWSCSTRINVRNQGGDGR